MFSGLLRVCAEANCSISLPRNYREPIKHLNLNNRSCQVGTMFININSNEAQCCESVHVD